MPYTDAAKVIQFCGVTPKQIGAVLPDEDFESDAEKLEAVLTDWILWVDSEIATRLGESGIPKTDIRYNGLVGIETRFVANLCEAAKQIRIGTVIDVGGFKQEIVNTTQFFKELDVELKPYKRSKIVLISSKPALTESA